MVSKLSIITLNQAMEKAQVIALELQLKKT